MVLTFREATRTGKLSGALGLAAEREARLARTHCSVKPGPKSKRDGPSLSAAEKNPRFSERSASERGEADTGTEARSP